MATPSTNRVILPADVLYLVTFAAGMLAFWASGHASVLALHSVHSRSLYGVLSLVVTGGVYGLGMLILSLVVLRRLGKGVVISTLAAIALGLGAAQIIVRLAVGHVHTTNGVAMLTFGLYMCYGLIYVASLALGRRFAK